MAELFAMTAVYLIAFYTLIDPMRRLEVNVIAGVFHVLGSRGVNVAPNDALLIARSGQHPILAGVSASCSSLMGILALGALAVAVLRRRRGHTLVGYVVASGVLFVANTARMAASCLLGLAFGHGALILFHDWVGTVWNFVATLLGFLLLLYLTLPTSDRAEQDSSGRHTARRPESWARVGLGYRMPSLVRLRPPRRTFTGWLVRHLVPAPQQRRLARRREATRIDYRIGYLEIEQRCQAIAHLAADGLEAHGASLLAVATFEEEPRVLEALSDAVMARWPTSTRAPAVAALCFWVRGWGSGRDGGVPEEIPLGVWRLLAGRGGRRRRSQADRLTASLGDAELASTIPGIASEGLGYRREQLLGIAASRSDPEVLAALCGAVAGRQWEPTTSMGVTALRLFARGWLFMPVEAPAPVPDRRSRALPDGAAPAESVRRVRVLVTGVGGPAGFAVCRDLITSGHQVIAVDSDPLAAGLRLEGVLPYVCPRADDDGFGEELLRIAGREGAEALISTVTEELPALIPLSARLSEIGCLTWFPSPSAVEHCLDKGLFAVTMRDYGIAHPPTARNLHLSRYVPGPFVVKPNHGRGSRGVAYIDTRRAMRQALRRDPTLIVQSRLVGREWTADVLVDRSGTLVTCVPRWRVEVRGGISTKGVTFTSEDVTRLCAQALEAVGLTGVANVQGVVDPDGGVAIIEINPRFSGGLPLSLAARADLVGAYLGGILEPQRHLDRMYFVPGTVMVRHFEEMFERPDANDGARQGRLEEPELRT